MKSLAKYIAPVLLLGLFLFSCRKKEEEKPLLVTLPAPTVSADVRVVATVNGDPITLAEFQERFARAGLKPEKEAEMEVREEFLNRLIERKMLLREAQRRRLKISLPEINKRLEAMRVEHGKDVKEVLAGMGIDFEKWKSDIWEDMMMEKLLAHEIDRHVSVSPSEIRRYYQANLKDFEKPEQVHVRQIVVATEVEAQKAQELLQSGSDFGTLARERSTAPEAENNGDLGYFAMGEMPAEFNVVFGMAKGGVSGIVKSPYGFHIFKLEDKRRAGRRSLEESYKEIKEKLFHEKQNKKYKQWLKELRLHTKFEVNYPALQ